MSLHDRLESYQPTWAESRQRRQRSLVPSREGDVSGDYNLEVSYQAVVRHMDVLLELYFAELNAEVPLQGYQEVDGRGSQ